MGAWATGTGLAGVVGGVLYGGTQARRGPTIAPPLLRRRHATPNYIAQEKSLFPLPSCFSCRPPFLTTSGFFNLKHCRKALRPGALRMLGWPNSVVFAALIGCANKCSFKGGQCLHCAKMSKNAPIARFRIPHKCSFGVQIICTQICTQICTPHDTFFSLENNEIAFFQSKYLKKSIIIS